MSWKLARMAMNDTNLKLRRHAWNLSFFIYFYNEKWLDEQNRVFFRPDFDLDDWEICTPPKVKKKLYKYAYKERDGSVLSTLRYFENTSDAYKSMSTGTIIIERLDYTEIEVDE